ncbi:hypothetical protein [Vagococcus bubulae]|nr:hypothetical protein [Vagococcus bubulae]
MNKTIKRVYQFLLTLLSILCLTIACEVVIARTFLLSSEHWITVAKESNYTKSLTDSINQSIQDVGMASGIKKDGLKPVVTQSEVTKDFNQFLTSAFKGQTYEIEKSVIEKKLQVAVEEYAKKENKPINEVNQESVNQFVEEGVNIYNGKVHNVMISTIGLRVSLIKKMTNILLIVSIVLLGILMLCLYFASGRYKHVFVRNVAYLVTSTGLLLVSFTMILSINNPLTHLSIIDDHMKKWITESIKLLMTVQIVVSIVFLVLGILLSLYSYKEYKKLEQRGFRRKQQTFDEIEGY